MKKLLKINVCQMVAVTCLAATLSSCTVPEKPQGSDQDGFAHIGDTLLARGDAAGASTFYQKTLEKNPRDVQTRLKILNILEASGDKETAKVGYEEGLRYMPDNVDLLRGYGRLLLQCGMVAQARDRYEHALRIEPTDIRSLNGLGVTLDVLGQHDQAQKSYLAALDKSSDDMPTLSNLGHSYVLSGKPDEAIKLLEPHVDDAKATPAMRQNLAEAYGMAGMDADAERVGLKDLSPGQVQHNAAAYHLQRKHLALEPANYADLGDFPTNAVAQTQIDSVKSEFPDAVSGLNFVITPEVKSIGGTPKFTIYVKGFAKKDALDSFCKLLHGNGINCRAISG